MIWVVWMNMEMLTKVVNLVNILILVKFLVDNQEVIIKVSILVLEEILVTLEAWEAWEECKTYSTYFFNNKWVNSFREEELEVKEDKIILISKVDMVNKLLILIYGLK